MISMTPPSPDTEQSHLTPKILELRHQYQSCHIHLPGEERRLPAIKVNDKYYSLAKVVKDPQKALEICTRLARRGHETVITPLTKGSAIWRLEPEAYTIQRSSSPAKEAQAGAAICQILESRSQYTSCHIRVPDLDQRLAAVEVNGRYYGLLKVVETREKALNIVTKLKPKGNEIVITKVAGADAIWVLEPDAELDRS